MESIPSLRRGNLTLDDVLVLLADHRHQLDLSKEGVHIVSGHVLQDRALTPRLSNVPAVVHTLREQAHEGLAREMPNRLLPKVLLTARNLGRRKVRLQTVYRIGKLTLRGASVRESAEVIYAEAEESRCTPRGIF